MSIDVIRGLLSTEDINTSRIVIPFDKEIHMLDPDRPTLFSLASIFGTKEKVGRNKFEWDEDDWTGFKTQINNGAGYSATDTILTVDDASIFRVNDLVQHKPPYGETMLITAVDSDNNKITVTRSYGSVAAGSLSDDDYMLRIGSANKEGGGLATPFGTKTETLYNYCQIFKNTVEVTKSLAATEMRNGINERLRRQVKAGKEHLMDIDRAFLFGERKLDTTTFDEVTRMTGGVFEFIQTNVTTDASGTLTRAEWDAFLEDQAFLHGSEKKICICGSTISEALSSWMDGKLQLNENAKKLGMSLREYISPTGKTLLVTHHPLFKETPELAGTALVVDIQQGIKIKYLRDTALELNKPTTDDKIIDEWLTETGIQVSQEKTHAVYKGVTAYS